MDFSNERGLVNSMMINVYFTHTRSSDTGVECIRERYFSRPTVLQRKRCASSVSWPPTGRTRSSEQRHRASSDGRYNSVDLPHKYHLFPNCVGLEARTIGSEGDCPSNGHRYGDTIPKYQNSV